MLTWGIENARLLNGAKISLYFPCLSVLTHKKFPGPFAAGALKSITPCGSFRNLWGFSFPSLESKIALTVLELGIK